MDPALTPEQIDQLRIVAYPAPVLRQTALPVDPIDDAVRAVAARMLDLMREAKGVGLAAPQVGLPWRMFVCNPGPQDDPNDPNAEPVPEPDRVFINPTLSAPSRDSEPYEEGCLSLPGIRADIRRPVGVTIAATDLDGNAFTLTSDAFPARVWQHELDHLNGVLIIDKMRPLDRRANQRVLRDLEAEGAPA